MSYHNLLSRATESTDAPTPGYIYVDLAKAATGNPNACQEMAKYLTNRLASKHNPNVKFKCCKVISKLCDQVPRNYFRRCVAQDPNGITAIKEAMQYRGTPDPVRGDEPNERVRQAAKECLDAVYREAPNEAMAGTAYSGGAGYNGSTNSMSNQYGAPPHSNASSSMGGRMQGIGNPNYPDPRSDPRHNEPQGLSSAVKEVGEVIVGMIKDPLARNIGPDVPRQGHSGNLPGYGGPSYGRPPPGSAELSRRTDGQWTMASNRGPGAVQEYQRDAAAPQPYVGGGGASAHTGSVGGSWGSAPVSSSSTIRPGQNYSTPSITINSVPGTSSGGGGTAISDGSYERSLILELCPPGGMKPVPPPDKLANFARTCSSLNSDLVCPVLLDCLEEGQPWVIRAKALCTMESAIANGTKPDGANPYRDFFFACRDEVSPLANHPRSAIHEPARRVLKLLGVATSSIPTTAAAPIAAAPPPPNLLDFDDEPAPTNDHQPPPSVPPPPPPPTSGLGDSMFGGMQVKSSVPSAQQPITSQPASSAAPTQNLLDFDAVTTPPVDIPASHDVFQSTSSPIPPQQPTVSAASSMFDQLSVKDKNDKTDGDIATVVNNASSAFGFINTAEMSPVPAMTQQSFDPLKNPTHTLTPNSAQKKVMEMSPEQMQAMAYQQMMMQQQQQMQMQMMMQQQMTGGVMPMPGLPMYPPLVGNIGVVGGGVRRTPSLGSPNPMQQAQPTMSSSFSFAPKPAQKDDKKFDFVKDAMAGHKK